MKYFTRTIDSKVEPKRKELSEKAADQEVPTSTLEDLTESFTKMVSELKAEVQTTKPSYLFVVGIRSLRFLKVKYGVVQSQFDCSFLFSKMIYIVAVVESPDSLV